MSCRLCRNPIARVDHSPGPFNLVTYGPFKPVQINDRSGRYVASTAYPASSHPVERVMADAMLFRASPALLQAAKTALPLIGGELQLILEAHCRLGPDLAPIIETLDDDVRPAVEELLHAQELLVAAILLAEGD